MKTLKSILLASLGVAFVGLTMTSCSKSESKLQDLSTSISSPVSLLSVSADGVSSFYTSSLNTIFNDSLVLTSDEQSFLFSLREDERVARDLYASFYDLYQQDYFNRVSHAESSHMKAVENLLSFYAVDYPDSLTAGVFADEDDQNLYNVLLSKGGDSLVIALSSAAYLEEMNVSDYSQLMPNISNENISLVVSHLLKGSRNHLRLFTRLLAKEGITYEPVVLDSVSYNEIIQTPIEKGVGFCESYGKHPRGMDGDSIRMVRNDSCYICGGKIIPGTKDSTYFEPEGLRVGDQFRHRKH